MKLITQCKSFLHLKSAFIQQIVARIKYIIAIVNKIPKTSKQIEKNLKSNLIVESGFMVITFRRIGRKKRKVVKRNFCFMAFND